MIASSLIMVFIYALSYFNEVLGLPTVYDNLCCIDDRRFNVFFIFLTIFIFTIIFVNLNENKFKIWKKFTFIYLLIYLFIYFLSPTQGNGFVWFQRETISFFGPVFYLFVSIILVFYKSLKKEPNQNVENPPMIAK